jgi:hypothetical protein
MQCTLHPASLPGNAERCPRRAVRRGHRRQSNAMVWRRAERGSSRLVEFRCRLRRRSFGGSGERASAALASGQEPFLCDGPCHGGVSHAPLLGDRPGALALGEALASDTAPDAASDEPRAASPQACGASPVAPQHLADIGGGRPQRLLGDGKAKWPSGSSSEEVAPTLPRCAVAIRRAVTGPPFRSGR